MMRSNEPEAAEAELKRTRVAFREFVSFAVHDLRVLERLHRELMDLNQSAARSLEEGIEETLAFTTCACRTSSAGRCAEPTFGLPQREAMAGCDQIEHWLGSG
jgi:hypothetical protein